MRNLLSTLLEYDTGMLAIIAARWDVDLATSDKRAAAETLAEAMLDPARAAHEWGRLSDNERGALQMLHGSPDHRMTEAMFSRLYGDVRQMGPGRRDREKPHVSPVSVAEALYYRGLMAQAFDQGQAGVQAYVYVPTDLAAMLPVHETGFDLSADSAPAAGDTGWAVGDEVDPASIHPANTTLVDDMVTLIVYLRIHDVPAARDDALEQVQTALAPHWLSERHSATVALLLDLALGYGLIADDGGHFKPAAGPARQWLELTRPRQVRALAETWRDSTLFNDLWYVPGLLIEDTGWRNDPLLARQAILRFLQRVPAQDWWGVDEFVDQIYEQEADFQRPGGDYESWYIRDEFTDEYLRGFESWDEVDGAVLRFILTGALHWLGLIDLAQGGALCRLTVYGRALCGESDWPDPAEDRPNLNIQNDGTILVPRTLGRYERFQLARITEWDTAGDPYTYRLTAAGLQQAAAQGIDGDAIRAFLRRVTGDTLPASIQRMVEQWDQLGEASVWIAREVVLRTTTPEELQAILENPELRRFLGATLGPMAVIVRAGQENDLATALRQNGILLELHD